VLKFKNGDEAVRHMTAVEDRMVRREEPGQPSAAERFIEAAIQKEPGHTGFLSFVRSMYNNKLSAVAAEELAHSPKAKPKTKWAGEVTGGVCEKPKH
jgi:hypothetical protein